MFISLLIPVLMIFFQIGIGILLEKGKVLDDNAPRTLASLLTNVTMPLMSFVAMLNNINVENLKSMFVFMAIMLSLSLLLHLFSKLYVKLLGIPDYSKGVHQFTIVQSNSAFVGVAVITALWGNEAGIFIGLIHITTSIYVNTLGVLTLGSGETKMRLKDLLLTPMFIGCVLGILFGLLRVQLPQPLLNVLQNFGNMTTPLAMIYTGLLMAKMDLVAAIKKKGILITSIFRLIVIPIAVYMILKPLFGDQYYLYAVPTIIEAMPAFTLLPVFAGRFKGDVESATALTAATTVLSLITIPFIILVLF